MAASHSTSLASGSSARLDSASGHGVDAFERQQDPNSDVSASGLVGQLPLSQREEEGSAVSAWRFLMVMGQRYKSCQDLVLEFYWSSLKDFPAIY